MKNADVLIVGSGAAGLMAAYTLAKAGKKVTVLEACNRTGGRIRTIGDTMFFTHAELGAEFVHGNLPVTLQLLREAGIAYHPAGGEMWQYKDGTFVKDAAMIEGWDMLMQKLNDLQDDTTLQAFLDKYFAEEKFDALRDSVIRYAAGYDTSDPARVSALALRREWQNEDEDAQYRIEGGYCTLINYLTEVCKQHGGTIYLNAPVTHISWQPAAIKATTADGEIYEARQVILAIPLGVWQAPAIAKGHIDFSPPISEQTTALKKLGFGAIIKVLLQFDEMFWENVSAQHHDTLKDMAFLFTDEAIPTWWTQAPGHQPLLTGWLGGAAAAQQAHTPAEDILQQSLQSLSHVFNIDSEVLKEKLIAWHVANWTTDPYICGSYAYDTVDTSTVLALLKQPIADTIYFAGEFMYQGPAMGTVEAALISGRDTAQKLLKL
ncbi:NAD(P)/FAD-dependent oxidoreductase [Mucilaginibacter sp. CSA2-8R]|uniref:flavin monoamine oxidase family protein n=1 Tax=Mucilaginibacter sp. CSA2-8R TaxID=3141542 RepID=UPI00315CE4EC